MLDLVSSSGEDGNCSLVTAINKLTNVSVEPGFVKFGSSGPP